MRLDCCSADHEPHAIRQFTLFGVLWISFLFYPLWYLPGSTTLRWGACIGLMLFVTSLCALYRYLCQVTDAPELKREPVPDRFFFANLFIFTCFFHAFFLRKPILTGLDTIDHAAVPAVIAHQIVKSLTHFVRLHVQSGLTGIAVITVIFFFTPTSRRWLEKRYLRLSHWSCRHSWLVLALMAGITLTYAGIFLAASPFNQPGELKAIFRYPPLSKLIIIPAYLVLGIHEFIGRGIQSVFTLAGAIYLYRITRLFGGIVAARCAAMLMMMLPPVFHYGNTNMIDCGLLFFMSATYFYWIRHIVQGNHTDLLTGTLFATLACLYKHPAVSLMPSFALMIAGCIFWAKQRWTFRPVRNALLACLIPGFTLVLYMKLSGFNSDVPSNLQIPGFRQLWGNIQAIPQGVTWPITLLFLAGLFAMAMGKQKLVLPIILGWIIPHYLLSCMSETAFNVRQALPYYLGLIIPAALLLEKITAKNRILRIGLLGLVLPCYLISACLFMSREQDYHAIGRPMGDRSYINFSNVDMMYLPYGKVIETLKNISRPGHVIYAPMANEPVYFYMAKYDFAGREYRREFWENDPEKQTVENLLAYCRSIHARFLVLPRGKWLYGHVNSKLVESLFTDPPASLQFPITFTCGKEEIRVWQIAPGATAQEIQARE